MSVPVEGILALMGFGLIVFVLVFIRRYSDIISKGKFRILLSISLALIFITSVYIWYYTRPPKDRTRIAFFPIVESNSTTDNSWQTWGVASIAVQTLNDAAKSKLLTYPLVWLWESINPDSITFPEYIFNYAKRIRLDYFVVGNLDTTSTTRLFRWELFTVKNRDPLASGTFKIKDSIQQIGVDLAKSVSSKLNLDVGFKKDKKLPESLLKWTLLGEKAYANKNYPLCIENVEKAFIADSSNNFVRNLLATAHLKLGLELKSKGKPAGIHYAIARTLCENTLKHDSLDAAAERILGEYYLLKELWAKAEDHFRRARKLNPHDAVIYRDFAQLHVSRVRDLGFRSEKDLLKYALFLNPCYEEARIRLAQYYYFKQWPSRAEKVIQKLLWINPNSVEGLLYLSKIYVSQNEIMKLLETGKRAIEIAPNNADAYFNLGVAYYHWEDYKNAQTFFQQAVDLDDHLNSHLYLAYIYERFGDHQQAIQHLRRRLHLRRDDIYANKARELLYQLTHIDSTESTNANSIAPHTNQNEDGIEVGVSKTQF